MRQASASGHPIKDARIFRFKDARETCIPPVSPPSLQDGVVSAGFAVLSASGENPLVRLV